MNIRLDIHKDLYVVISKHFTYGFVLTMFTPPRAFQGKLGKKDYSEELFYPDLLQVARKITWLGLDSSELNELINKMDSNTDKLCKALKEL